MIERFNRTCLMMLSMFVNDRRDNWHELLPFIMHAYRTSVHESTGYSPFRLMMGRSVRCRKTSRPPSLELNGKMMWHHTHLLHGFGTRWKWRMIMSGVL